MWGQVVVNVPTGSTINNQNKTVSPTESQQQVTYDSGYTGLGTVTVNAISSTYVGSEITRRSSTDLTASGDTVTVPAGYYSTQSSKSVASGSAGTPVATKGTVSNNSISITPSVTNTTGYITGDTKTGTAVSVSASELVSGTLSITTNGTKDVTNYKNVNVNISGDSPTIESLSITPSESEQTFDSSSVDGYKPVTVGAISSTYIGSGVTQRSSTDLTVSGATVSVPAGYYASSASKAVAGGSATNSGTASASSATITTGTNTITLSKAVSITPSVSAGYISAGTAGNVTVSLTGSATIDPTPTASGKTVTIPAGYYTESTTKDVSTGSATGPSSLSGSSASITTGTNTITLTKTGVTTTPTVSAGYVSSATASTATVALTASVTVNPTPTASGATVTIPAGYYSTQTTKSVSSGSATAPASISGTSATVSTGTNTLTLTKTVSVTPSVSAGYISSGTAGNSSVSLTASVTTKAAATITPGTSNQTIASGTYLTGTQTIAGDADLVAGNIKSGVQIFGVTGSYAGIDTSDATAAATDIVTGKTAYVDGRKVEGSLVIQKYYTGSSAPASSLGNNGDIYFQS